VTQTILELIFCVAKITYIMYNAQDYSVLYVNAVRRLHVVLEIYSPVKSTCITASFH